MQKINWDVEELVALINIFERSERGQISDLGNELETLSSTLNKRARILGIPHDEKFRNLNGMKLMYQNVSYVASHGMQGLSAASKKMYLVYDLFMTKREVFDLILHEYLNKYCR